MSVSRCVGPGGDAVEMTEFPEWGWFDSVFVGVCVAPWVLIGVALVLSVFA